MIWIYITLINYPIVTIFRLYLTNTDSLEPYNFPLWHFTWEQILSPALFDVLTNKALCAFEELIHVY